MFPIPTTPTRILMSSSPAARSLADYVNALYGRYQSAADNPDTGALATYALASATSAASIAKHQRTEAVWDLTAAGTLSSGCRVRVCHLRAVRLHGRVMGGAADRPPRPVPEHDRHPRRPGL